MNSIGLSILIKSCICLRDSVEISGSKYTIVERIAVGNVKIYFLMSCSFNFSVSNLRWIF